MKDDSKPEIMELLTANAGRASGKRSMHPVKQVCPQFRHFTP